MILSHLANQQPHNLHSFVANQPCSKVQSPQDKGIIGERNSASFDADALASIFAGGSRNNSLRKRAYRLIERDPILNNARYSLSSVCGTKRDRV